MSNVELESPADSAPAVEPVPVKVSVEKDVSKSKKVKAKAKTEELNSNQDKTEGEITSTDAAGPNGTGFHAFGLKPALIKALDRSGYTQPTPIQEQTIAHLMAGRDVVGQAQTGTGKTAAFALPTLHRINISKRAPQVLVLTPTRELAIQVAKAFETYARDLPGLSILPIYGGQEYQAQLRPLKRGVQVVVGTPGRVMDHMRRGALKLDDLQCLVLDEADEMLRMGFAEDVDWILSEAPTERQIALFSATMPRQIREIAQKHLNDPAEVTIAQKAATADTVNQRYVVCSPRYKQTALARILEAEPTDAVIVFVKMRSTTEPLAEHLAKAGFKTAALNGDVAQKKRERIVEKLRKGEVDVLIATDVAARGLDVQRISHVFNYDLPHDSEAYVHRIGRTGRAGRSGEAILFLSPKEKYQLTKLERATRQKIEPMELPSNRLVNKQRVARFHDRITHGLTNDELESFQSIVQQYQRENDIPIEMIAASLAVLANQERGLLVKGELKQNNFEDRGNRKFRDRDDSRKGGSRSSAPRERRADVDMQTYRIEVGRKHHVQPGNIVGAIANNANLEGNQIGRIQIYDNFSTVDLPQGVDREKLETLNNVEVGGQKLRIKQFDERPPAENRRDRRNSSAKPFTKPFTKPFAKRKKKATPRRPK